MVTKLSKNEIFSSSSFWEKHCLKGTEICFWGGEGVATFVLEIMLNSA
jgi:hypothetical protein